MNVKIEKIDPIEIDKNSIVKYTEMGNIIEIQYMSKRNNKQTVQMLPGMKQYIVMDTGEIKDIEHHETRATQYSSLKRTFANIRSLINTNVADKDKVRWITLTYAENMTDTKQLYNDFEKFNKRFQYKIKKLGYNKAEYIAVMEPQGRGAWHCHMFYIFDCKAPFIPNNELRDTWGHGFVTIKQLNNIDNPGAYLTAYLGDMELEDAINNVGLDNVCKSEIKEVEFLDDEGNKVPKKFVKGARLHMYPANFNMYRTSKGIKRPSSEMITQEMAEKKVSAATLTYEKTLKLEDTENDFEAVISTRYYNRIRVNNQ
ncbi:MAG: hypothetical protein GX365_02790 [Clostridiales bacterium]|nr:hypothetical protein [Clostridiales bacterium]